jgi:hypothetical protein
VIRQAARESLIALGLAAATLAIHLLYWNRGFILLDEGFVATVASVMAHGGRLYRDAVSYALPGGYALLALVFWVFGESLQVSRGLTLALLAILVPAAFRVARAALSLPAAALAVALVGLLTVWSFPQWQVYGYQQPGLVAVLLAAALLAPEGAASGLLRPALAGLLVGAAVCTKQTNLAAGATLGLFLLVDRLLAGRRGDAHPWRAGPVAAPLLAFAAGGALPVLWTFGSALHAGTLGDLWVQSVLSPLHGADFDGYVGLPDFRRLFERDEDLRGRLVHYLPPLLDTRRELLLTSRLWRWTSVPDFLLKMLYLKPLLVAGLGLPVLAWRLRHGWSAVRGGALLFALDLGLLAGMNRPFDWMHESFAWIGTLLLGTWIVAPGEQPRRGILRGLAIFTGCVLVVTLFFVLDLRRVNSEPVHLARAGVYARPADARAIERIVGAIEEHAAPGEAILVVPYQPLVDFLAARPPASRFLLVWPVEYQSSRDAEMLAEIDRRGVRTVIHGATAAPQLGTLAGSAPVLLEGLAERFRVAEVIAEDPRGISFLRLERRVADPTGTWRLALPADTPLATWPFERVIASTLRPGEAAEVRIAIPAGTTGDLVLGWGANPDRWIDDRPLPLVFAARFESAGDTRALLRDEREPRHQIADRPWQERRVPLDGRAGVLVLSITPGGDAPPGDDLAGWTLPRIEPARSWVPTVAPTTPVRPGTPQRPAAPSGPPGALPDLAPATAPQERPNRGDGRASPCGTPLAPGGENVAGCGAMGRNSSRCSARPA